MSALLLDFFGTLVGYSPSRTAQGYRRCHEFLLAGGATLPYEAFLTALDACFATFDRSSDADDHEFAMADVATALVHSLGLPARCAVRFEELYIAEWSAGVAVLDGVPDLLRDLRTRHRLAVVSNTHSPTMVPDLLTALGVADLFEAVILSVDVGRCKPHPLIYQSALKALDTTDAVFVGDTYLADYAGPTAVGIPAFLIDPAGAADVPADRRLASVLDLPHRLAS
jgi:putative hydrolase of the HAD superfamily